MGSRFSYSLLHPFGSPFWCHFGGAGRHYTPSGVLLGSFGAPLGALLGTCWSHWALVGRLLGLLGGSSLDAVKWLKCGFWNTWAPPGRHYTAFGGSFALAGPPLEFPGPPLTPSWVSPGALWVRSRCYFPTLQSGVVKISAKSAHSLTHSLTYPCQTMSDNVKSK